MEMMKIVIFNCLFLGFYLLFLQGQILEWICASLKKSPTDTNMEARLKGLENKTQLIKLQEHHTLWFRLEQWLYYSGIRQRFPGRSAEFWTSGNLMAAGAIFLISAFFGGIRESLAITVLFITAEAILLQYLRSRNLRAVNKNLIKLLKLLGNYNITSAEIANVFNHVSRYMEEPIRTVLQECYLEAQVTGDVGMAILSMGEKIEHPQFKELARNIEIGIRYGADFTTLIDASRRSVREYWRIVQEKRNSLREAIVNMLMPGAIFLLLWIRLQKVCN